MEKRVPEEFDPGDTTIIKVANTLYTLQQLARWYRDALGMVVVSITKSNGKTTTKDFTASVLRQRFCKLETVVELEDIAASHLAWTNREGEAAAA